MVGRVQDEHPITYMFASIFVFGGFFLALYLYFSPPEYDGSETIPISAIQLLDEFGQDEAFSTFKYEGKWLEITGLAGSTEMVGRGAKLEIRPMDYDDGFFADKRTVICYLSEVGEEQYARDRPRGEITVIGTFMKKRIMGVSVESCEFIL